MAPKKVAVAVKEIGEPMAGVMSGAPDAGVENGALATEKTKAKPKVAKMKTLGNPTTLSMVVEALKKDPEKKGTSVPAIRNRILAAHPTVDPIRLKFLLKSALNKGIEKGILIRPTNSSATGATGRFKLAKPGKKPKEEGDGKTSENADPNVQPKKTKEKPKKEAIKKVPKKSKAEKGESTDENTKVKATNKKEKASEPKAAASKPKKDPVEKTTKTPAPAKKPKAKIAAAEEGAIPKKRAVKMKAESPEKDSEEKTTAKGAKKGKK